MPVSAVQGAKRTPIKANPALTLQSEMAIKARRDSADKDVVSADKRSSTKVHPDKGRQTQNQQKPPAARRIERRLRRWDCQVDESPAFANSSQVSWPQPSGEILVLFAAAASAHGPAGHEGEEAGTLQGEVEGSYT